MKLSEDLQKKLTRKFEPSATINMRYKGNDIDLKTDAEGNAVQFFLRKMDNHGVVKGERYSRVLKYDKSGTIIKDHWDLKGKTK